VRGHVPPIVTGGALRAHASAGGALATSCGRQDSAATGTSSSASAPHSVKNRTRGRGRGPGLADAEDRPLAAWGAGARESNHHARTKGRKTPAGAPNIFPTTAVRQHRSGRSFPAHSPTGRLALARHPRSRAARDRAAQRASGESPVPDCLGAFKSGAVEYTNPNGGRERRRVFRPSNEGSTSPRFPAFQTGAPPFTWPS
jgi:hypothetical protein